MFRDEPLAWGYHRNSMFGRRTAPNVQPRPDDSTSDKEYAAAPLLRLPAPRVPDTTLADAIRLRRSCRAFSASPLVLADLSALLAAAYGMAGGGAGERATHRPVPSGGGLYPLELYLLAFRVEGASPGVHHYHPREHSLERVRDETVAPSRAAALFLDQSFLESAAAVAVITAVPDRSLWKYRDRGYRYLLLEAGHLAQNLNLMAAALDLGCLDLGGFYDADLGALLGLDLEREIPLYGVAVGNRSV